MRHQRWFYWRNRDVTTCPGHGIVLLFAPPEGLVTGGGAVDVLENLCTNEVYGTDIILHGVRPSYNFAESPGSLNRGITNEMAFNGGGSVAPGGIGLCTFDLPAWGIVDNPPLGSLSDVNYITVFNDWVLHFHTALDIQDDGILLEQTGLLYVLGYDTGTQRALLGKADTYIADDERDFDLE